MFSFMKKSKPALKEAAPAPRATKGRPVAKKDLDKIAGGGYVENDNW